ncbi:MAG TPA: iron chelate uptake ABC transporter family permease subunit, partial [Methanosarcina sp.]|nr:iron chelate uptake ABC transporter family permease subunit [Methanosarcina sp.]
GLFLLCADIAAQRAVYPLALPVGIVTSFAGVPVFLYLLVKRLGKNAGN